MSSPTLELAGRRVLVTGGAGFIGSHLVQALAEQGARPRVLVHYNSRGLWGHLDAVDADVLERVEVVLGDVADPFSVRGAVAGCELVFHLAALIGIPYSYVAPHSYVATNVTGTLNVLEACRQERVARIVHTSTSETYGTALYTPIDEKHPLQGQSPYSASKIGADKLVESYVRSFDLPAVTLRPFNTFGPRQSARAVIPSIIAQALRGGDVRVGSLTPIRDLTYVEDTVRAFLLAGVAGRAVGRTINAGNGKGITIGELAARILAIMGQTDRCRIVQDPARVRPDASEVFELVCDAAAARELLGWQPLVTLEEGLRRTIDYVAHHATSYKADVYNV